MAKIPPYPLLNSHRVSASVRHAPQDGLSLADCPLLVLVGVTGVGKSTPLAALTASGFAYHLLPDRRELTDRLIIPSVQAHDGEPLAPVKDRKLRFEYTRTYRELITRAAWHMRWRSSASIPRRSPAPLLFDGLRGANEVTHAASLLPRPVLSCWRRQTWCASRG